MDLSGVIEAAQVLVHQSSIGRDGSHDYWHIKRVRKLALHIARSEGLQGEPLQVVELAALLHDVQDWKYGNGAAGEATVQAFLNHQGVADAQQQRIMAIINNLGFKDSLGNTSTGSRSRELDAVQDADRLDATGAVGIARCFTYGGAFQRVLHDPECKPEQHLTQAAYMDKSRQQTTINHFHEKLLKLKDLMRTETGRKLAQQRHDFMESFLQQFYLEWEGQA